MSAGDVDWGDELEGNIDWDFIDQQAAGRKIKRTGCAPAHTQPAAAPSVHPARALQEVRQAPVAQQADVRSHPGPGAHPGQQHQRQGEQQQAMHLPACQPHQQRAPTQATALQGPDSKCPDPNSEVILLSADSCASEYEQALYPTEFLNCLDPTVLPPHKLRLRVGMPIVLLKDLNPLRGQAKGTRLIVKRASQFVLDAEIATGSHVGQRLFIPRITMSSSEAGMQLRRRQFPVRPA